MKASWNVMYMFVMRVTISRYITYSLVMELMVMYCAPLQDLPFNVYDEMTILHPMRVSMTVCKCLVEL